MLDLPKKFFRLAGARGPPSSHYFITCTEAEIGPNGEVTCQAVPMTPRPPAGRPPTAARSRRRSTGCPPITPSTSMSRSTNASSPTRTPAPTARIPTSLNPDAKNQAKAEPAIADIAPGDVVQFERSSATSPARSRRRSAAVPTMFHRTVGLRAEGPTSRSARRAGSRTR